MKNPIRIRKLGLLLIILAVSGMIFSLISITAVWIVRPAIKSGALEIINILDSTLKTTDSGLGVLDQSIENAKSDLVTLQDSLEELGTTLDDVSATMDTSADLIGNDLQLTVINTQVALSSAATSAEVIDDTLAFLAAIPIIGADYEPEVPLHVSLQQIADGMEDVPATLVTLEGNLSDTSSSLNSFSDNLTKVIKDLDSLSSDLSEAQDTLADYGEIVSSTLEKTATLQKRLPGLILLGCFFLSGVLLWLGIAQVNVLMQGLAFRNDEMKVVNLADLSRD
jgi:methyl-accepting chemotaxis protein